METCFLCRAPAAKRGTSTGEFQCEGCGLSLRLDLGIWCPPGPKRQTGVIEYPETGAEQMMRIEENSYWFRHRYRLVSLMIEKFAPGATLLDIGGGNGYLASRFQQSGQAVVMVEPDLAGCRNAVGRGVRNVISATLEELNLRSGTIEAISILDVLEHLADTRPFLAEASRVLRPGGALLLTVPAFDALWSEEDVFARHQRRYSRILLRQVVEDAGFRVRHLGYCFAMLTVPLFLLRTLPYRLIPSRPFTANHLIRESDYIPPPWGAKFVDRLLEWEFIRIGRGRSPAFGTSLIAVAGRE